MSTIQQAASATTGTFITTLVFNAIVFGAEIAAFTLLRPHFKSIYEPRTFIPPPSNRSKPLVPSFSAVNPTSYLFWPYHLWNTDYAAIQQSNGLDAYFYVRFLRTLTRIFLPIWLISWMVLLPVTSVNSKVGNNSGLDLLVFGNVQSDKQTRFAAHIILVYLFTFWVYHNIRNEFRHFVVTRQRFCLSPSYAKTVQANTVLITGVPAKYLSNAALRKAFGVLPGGVKNIWINRDLKELPELYQRRLDACNKLEAAETKLLSLATKLHAKGNTNPESKTVPANQRPTHKLGFLGLFGKKVDTIDWARKEIRVCTDLLEEKRAAIPGYTETGGTSEFPDADSDSENEEAFARQGGFVGVASKVGYVGSKVGGKVGAAGVRVGEAGYRVGHEVGERVGKVGHTVRRKHRQQHQKEKVDEEALASPISRSNTEEKMKPRARERAGKIDTEDGGTQNERYPPLNSVFITFRRQIGAQLAGQVLIHHEPYRMSSRYTETHPNDVIWSNLGLNPYECRVRTLLSWAATIGLIVLWATPVAFVGTISNIYTVCSTAKWLNWICTLPPTVVGIISGILPPVLLAILFLLLPIVLRLLARFEGIPRQSGVELSLMDRFFVFLVLHGFLIVTLSAGIVPALKQFVHDPTSIASVLAASLPKASTFFLTYVTLQGLAGTAGGFLQIVSLVIYYAKLFLLGSTPRSIWGIKYKMGSVMWGTLFPNTSLLAVTAFGYSIISPVINGFACATFFAFYQMYKYLFLYVYEQNQEGAVVDTGGMFFVKGLKQIWVGLYVQQICLAALFFLGRDQNGNVSTMPEAILMVVLIVITVIVQVITNNSYGPLIHALPLTLVDKMYAEAEEELRKGELADADGKSEVHHKQRVMGNDIDRRGESIDTHHNAVATGDDIPLTSTMSNNPPPSITNTYPPPPLPHTASSTRSPHSLHPNKPPHVSPITTVEQFGFSHPAASRPQRPIWLPSDMLGLGEEEVAACLECGVEASRVGATMNEEGRVDVDGSGVPGEGR